MNPAPLRPPFFRRDGDFTSGDLVVAFQDGGYLAASTRIVRAADGWLDGHRGPPPTRIWPLLQSKCEISQLYFSHTRSTILGSRGGRDVRRLDSIEPRSGARKWERCISV